MNAVNSGFTNSNKKMIMEAKLEIARLIDTHIPHFMMEPNSKFIKSWCIAGGLFSSVIWGHADSDIDVWVFRDQKALYDLIIQKLNVSKKVSSYYDADLINTILTWKGGPSRKVQFLFLSKDQMNPAKIVDTFDYVHCQPYYYDNTIYISKYQFDCIVKKRLVHVGKKPSAKERVDKWISRGYKVYI